MAKKRGNGEGSISRRKNGGWMAQYAVYTAEGRKRKTLYGKTRQEVATKLARALSDREGGLALDADSLTVGEWMERWLEDCLKPPRASRQDGPQHVCPLRGHSEQPPEALIGAQKA
jgi:hypothetical protein